MDVLQLPPGESAPEGADRIILTSLKDGSFQVDGVIDGGRAVVLFSPPPFPNETDAITAALLWAGEHGEGVVLLERRKG